jgi:hypothetical protein
MKTFKQYNESLKDKMTPVTEDDIRAKLGEEKYHIYKSIKDAKDSIKPPYEIDEDVVRQLTDDSQISTLVVKIWFLKFIIRYDGELWSYSTQYNSENVEVNYRTWIEVYHQIINDTNKFFNKEIETVQVEMNRHQNKINNLQKELKKVNKLV